MVLGEWVAQAHVAERRGALPAQPRTQCRAVLLDAVDHPPSTIKAPSAHATHVQMTLLQPEERSMRVLHFGHGFVLLAR